MITNKDKLRQAIQHVHMTGEMDVEDEEWLESLVNEFEEKQEQLNKVVYVNEKGEPKITTKELILLLMDFEQLKKENEKLKNTHVERLEEYISQLEHEKQLLYGRLNMIRDLTDKEIK